MTERPALITMFTDAGVVHSQKIGTWAMWARTTDQFARFSGEFRDPITDSNHAELRAIVNALVIIVRKFQPERGARIIAQTDSLWAISTLVGKGKKTPARKRASDDIALARKIIADNGLIMDYRHVKGHSGTGTPRNAVNHLCDAECTRLIRAAVRRRILEQSERNLDQKEAQPCS